MCGDAMGKELPVRKSARLRGYDYSSVGAYFITICVKDGHELLWDDAPVGAHSVRPQLSSIGKAVETAITNIPRVYTGVKIDNYAVMPNHIHMILGIQGNHGRTLCAPTVARVVKQMKEYITKQIGYSIWQKSYHDHIIRDDTEYQKIWKYINENPMRWTEDEYYTK